MDILTKLLFSVSLLVIFDYCCYAGSKSKSKSKKASRRLKSGKGKCSDKFLTEYNLTFYGDWSSRVFSKSYPRYRPPAQWSKLIGRTHSTDYSLWSMGEKANPALATFAERADSSLLDKDAQAYRGIFDTFTAAPIESGMGRSAVRFLADGVHSSISFIVKIIPSPDWFVGVQHINLCQGKRWRKEVSFDLQPVDAGTDKGLTFTSPNWRSDPLNNISIITSRIPDHPASSFFYEHMDDLPRIAHVVITKVAEYKRRGKLLELAPTEPNVIIFDDGSDSGAETVNVQIDHTTTPNTPSNFKVENTNKSVHIQPENQKNPKTFKKTIKGNDILQKNLTDTNNDCLVTIWSEWSACSKTCSFGFMQRHREAIQMPGPGGLGCPPLTDQISCGSMRQCKWNHFGSLFQRSESKNRKTG